MSEEPLIGREHEWSVLSEALRRSNAGHGSMVSMVGEPGIGKSALLDAVRARATESATTVVWARAEEFEEERSFGLVGRLAAALPADAAARLRSARFDGPHPTDEPEVGFRVADTFVQVIEDLAADRPVIVLVDDLQWADGQSVLALRSLSSRLTSHAVCLVTAALAGAGSSRCRSLLAAVDHARHLELGPLSDDEARQLACRVIEADPSGDLLALLRRAEGVPSLVIALSAAWDAERPETSVPESVRHAVERQLGRLPDVARTILRLLALAARPMAAAEVTALVDRPVLEVADLIETVVRRRLLVDEGICLRYRHELVREAVLESTPGAVRQTMQLLVADALSAGARPSSPATITDLGRLTRAERRIVDLVAEGMTNLDIAATLSVSRRTVESHLYRAYPELGVGSRVELALLVSRSS